MGIASPQNHELIFTMPENELEVTGSVSSALRVQRPAEKNVHTTVAIEITS
jgi:hypothetical protein